MMKKRLIVLFLLTGLTFSAYSQTDTKKEKVVQLLELMGSKKNMAPVMDQVMGYFKKGFPAVDSTFWDEASKEANGDMDNLLNSLVPIYEKYYTESDIDELVKFYNSPVGKKVIAVMPQVLQESMVVGSEWGKKMAAHVLEKMKEKGYYKE